MNTRRIKSWFLAAVFAVFVGGTAVTALAPQPSLAASNFTCTSAPRLLTFPVWYRGLTVSESDCTITSPEAAGGLTVFIWRIVLNALDIALQLVGYVAVFFIIYGGFQFLTAAGEAQKAAASRQTILNAVIGLVISIGSVAIVNLVFTIIQ